MSEEMNYERMTQVITFHNEDGSVAYTTMQLVLALNGRVYAKLYWHYGVGEPVISAGVGSCMKQETAFGAANLLSILDTVLMVTEAKLNHPSSELLDNCKERKLPVSSPKKG